MSYLQLEAAAIEARLKHYHFVFISHFIFGSSIGTPTNIQGENSALSLL